MLLFLILRAEIIDEVRALRTLEYMTHEREFLPWYTALGTRLPYIRRMLFPTSAFGELQVIVLSYSKSKSAREDPFFRI